MQHYFKTLGGEPVLSAIIDTFVERVMVDPMIGFFFRHVDISRLKKLEYQHAAHFLGAPVKYEGRDLNKAHRRHAIMGGHFDRRLQILRDVLRDFEVQPEIQTAWIEQQLSLRETIVNFGVPTSCA
jgi:hemoglobin